MRRVLAGLTGAGLALAGLAAPASDAAGPPSFVGAPATAHPVARAWLWHNPHMAGNGAATMHADSYASDTHPGSGPLGRHPTVTVANKGPCAGVAFTREKLLVLQCGGVQSFTLRLVDPKTLSDLATYNLPPRPSTLRGAEHANLDAIYSDSSGAYFYEDEHDRTVVADAAQHVQSIAHVRAQDGSWSFRKVGDWDLTRFLPHDCESLTNPLPRGSCDPVTGVLPDKHGLLWWVSRYGRIGTINPRTGAVRLIWLRGEEIENSHAVSEDGVSVVSDHALYQLDAGARGVPHVVWRARYDRGTARKDGQINQGSGTTPTFLGRDYVAITDNAADRMHVLVYKRAAHVRGSRLVCAVPVFGHGRSASENSLIGWGDSVVVENNFGYRDPRPFVGRDTVPGGLERIDVVRHGRGCAVRWTSKEHSPSVVSKLSRGNGLVYSYTFSTVGPGVDAWYLTAIDFRTGRTVFKVLTGTGAENDNAWAPITLGPDGAAYVSAFRGIFVVRDGA